MAEENRGQKEEVPRSHAGDTGGRPRRPDDEYPKGRSHYEFGTHGGPGKPAPGAGPAGSESSGPKGSEKLEE